MKKKKFFSGKTILYILAFLVIALGVVFLVKAFYPATKTYHSDFLKITIDYPENFKLEEKFETITLKNNKGTIIISTNGTNYDSVDGYLDNLSELNNFRITKKEKVKLKYEDATIITIDNRKKDYFFYPTEWSIYFISASSPELYGDLDKIAESFRYEP